MEWNKIWQDDSKCIPPQDVWCEFYDGEKTMHSEKLHYIDKIDKYGDCFYNYLINYTHWRYLSAPNT